MTTSRFARTCFALSLFWAGFTAHLRAQTDLPTGAVASGTYTIPAGVTVITVEAWGAGGGGGGGGSGSNSGGSGGGGGAYVKKNSLSVTPGEVYIVNVGTGGSAGAAGSNGTAGGITTLVRQTGSVTVVSANGGAFGRAGGGATTAGGAGGSAAAVSVPDFSFAGGNGGSTNSAAGGGGGGGASGGGAGGSAGTAPSAGAGGLIGTSDVAGGAGGGGGSGASNDGTLGSGPGGGGGGGGKGRSGAAGAAGRLRVTYATGPVISAVPASQNYTEGSTGQLLLAPAAGFAVDASVSNLNGGYLRAEITANEVAGEDRLGIQAINNITLVTNLVSSTVSVHHSGILIGTVSAANNGLSGNPLQIDLNSNATPARVQDLLRSLHYQDADSDSAVASTRTVSLSASDGVRTSAVVDTQIIVAAEVFSITSPSTNWTRLLNASNFDPSEDQQARSGPDLVGADGTPLLYGKYDDKGTASTADDTVTFRLRVDDSLNSAGLYNGYVFVGYDFELDGDIDAFIALEGTTKGTKVYVYEASGANISPSTTGIGARYLIPGYSTATMSNYSRVETIEGITELAANSYSGADAEPDYFLTYQVNFADLATVLNPLLLNTTIDAPGPETTIGDILNTDLRAGFTELTPFRFIIATSTQPNSLNSDFGGIGRMSRADQAETWEDLGIVSPTITLGNSPPVISSGGSGATASYTIAENTTPVATVTATDANSDLLTYSILTGGSYGVDGAKFVIDPVTGALSFITAPDYEAPTDADGNNSYLVTVQVSDGKGGLDTQLITVYVTDAPEGANAQPIITSNGAGATATVSVAENSTQVTTVTSSDAGDYIASTVVAASATYSISGGADAASFTINPTTGLLAFVTAPNYEALPVGKVFEVIVRVTDGGSPVKTDEQTLSITVTDVYEPVAPVMVSASPTLPTIDEDNISNTGLPVSDLLGTSESDANGDIVGIAITGLTAVNGTWQYSLDAGANWIPVGSTVTYTVEEDALGNVTIVPTFTSTGTVSGSNALLLSSTDRVRFLPDQQNGSTTSSFTCRAWDQSSDFPGDYVNIAATGGSTPYSTQQNSAGIIVTDVNDAPTVSLQSTAGNPPVVIDLAAASDYQASTPVLVSTLLAESALNYGDVDTGHVRGAAVTASSGAGEWQYSSDGTTWTAIGAVSASSARLLPATYRLRYLPDYPGPDGGETASLTLRAWDQTSGTAGGLADTTTNGGTTAFSINPFLLEIDVGEDNRALTVSDVTVNEASPYAVFTVTGASGQLTQLTLGNNGDGDDLSDIEYLSGTTWLTYSGGSYVAIPASGTLLVRVALSPEQETAIDNGETFTLNAANVVGTSYSGTGTILDNGTGAVFLAGNTTTTPNGSGDAGYPALDDDRLLTVDSVMELEGSTYIEFSVTGGSNQQVSLSLQNVSTTGLSAIQYDLDGAGNWQNYTSGYVSLVGTSLRVRVNILPEDDSTPELSETFKLIATNTGGMPNTTGGVGTIQDDDTIAPGAGTVAQTICFRAPATASRQEMLPLIATATSGLPVQFSVVSGPATVSGNQLTFSGAGTVVVRAAQSGNSTYQAAPTVDQTIQALDISIPTGVQEGWRVTHAVGAANAKATAVALQVPQRLTVQGGTFDVRTAWGGGLVSNLASADALLGSAVAPNVSDTTAAVINFGNGSTGNFPDDAAFPGSAPGLDDFAVRVTGRVIVPESGNWTFGTNTDDGVRVKINGDNVILDDTTHPPVDRFGTVYLAAGAHDLELVFFERGGGEVLELFAAPGTRSSFDSSFALIGTTTPRAATHVAVAGYVTNASGNRDLYVARHDVVSGTQLWSKTYAGDANGNDEANAVVVDSQGDVIVAGQVTNATGNTDILVVKYAAANGALLWAQTYAGNGAADFGKDGLAHYDSYDAPGRQPLGRRNLAVGSDGSVVVGGHVTNAAGNLDLVVLKYDSAGTFAWRGSYDLGSGNDYAHAVAVDSAGNVYATGGSDGTTLDAVTVKFDASGTLVWSQRYDNGKPDKMLTLLLDKDEHPVVGGYTQEATFNMVSVRYNKTGSGGGTTILWESRADHPVNRSSDSTWDMSLVQGDDVILTGAGYSSAGAFNGYTLRFSGQCTTGLRWGADYNGPANKQDQMVAMGADVFGNPVVTGYSQNADGTYDVYTAKYRAEDGSFVWGMRLNGAAGLNEEPTAMAVDPSGNAFVAGYTTVAGGTTQLLVQSYQAYENTGRQAQTITFANPGAQQAGTALTLAATSSSGLPVQYSVLSGPAVLSGSQLTFTGTGTVTVRAWQPGTADYLAATPVDQTFTVSKSPQTISFALPSKIYKVNGVWETWPLTAVATSGLPVSYTVPAPATINSGVLTLGAAGDVTVQASQAGDERFSAAASVTATVTGVDLGTIVITNTSTLNWRDRSRLDPAQPASIANGEGNAIALQEAPEGHANAAYVAGFVLDANGKKDLLLTKYVQVYSTAVPPQDTGVGQQVWTRTLNGAANADDEALAVAVAGNGDVAVAGYRTTAANGRDLHVAKYNAAGDLQWEYTYNGTANGADTAVAVAFEGTTNVVVGGHVTNTGTGRDFFAAKLDFATGLPLDLGGGATWQRSANRAASHPDTPVEMAVGTDGSVVLAGGSGPLLSGYASQSEFAFTVKFAAADGALAWSRAHSFNASSPDTLTGLALDGANNVIVSGFSRRTNYDIYTAKYAADSGALLWESYFNGGSSDAAWDVAVDRVGNAFVVGNSYPSAGVRDGITVKLNGVTGAEIWNRKPYGTGVVGANDENFTVDLDILGNAVVTGYTTLTDATKDVYLSKNRSTTGEILNESGFDGYYDRDDSIKQVRVDPKGNVWMTGYTTDTTGQRKILVVRLFP